METLGIPWLGAASLQPQAPECMCPELQAWAPGQSIGTPGPEGLASGFQGPPGKWHLLPGAALEAHRGAAGRGGTCSPGAEWAVGSQGRNQTRAFLEKLCSGGCRPGKGTSTVNPSGQRCDGTSLGIQGLRSHTSTLGALGSIPCGRIEPPHAKWYNQKKKKRCERSERVHLPCQEPQEVTRAGCKGWGYL